MVTLTENYPGQDQKIFSLSDTLPSQYWAFPEKKSQGLAN